MRDRYAGDIGDLVKPGLQCAIAPGRKLGGAWYRFPDKGHNGDGRSSDEASNVTKLPVSRLGALRTFRYERGLRFSINY